MHNLDKKFIFVKADLSKRIVWGNFIYLSHNFLLNKLIFKSINKREYNFKFFNIKRWVLVVKSVTPLLIEMC